MNDDPFGSKTSKTPDIIICIIGGLMAFTLLSSFLNLHHVADEIIMIGGVFGAIVYLTGGFELAKSETSTRGSTW